MYNMPKNSEKIMQKFEECSNKINLNLTVYLQFVHLLEGVCKDNSLYKRGQFEHFRKGALLYNNAINLHFPHLLLINGQSGY